MLTILLLLAQDAPELVQLFERAVEQSGSSPSDAAAAAGAQLRAHAQDLGLSAAVTAGVEDALREAVNTAYGARPPCLHCVCCV